MKCMLDTNICIHIIRNRPASVLARFRGYTPQDMCISSVTLAELEYGVAKSSFPKKNMLALVMFLSGINILPFDDNAAIEYGSIRANLVRKGIPIGQNDMLIAAHAKACGLPIVTNNTREFARVDGLQVRNWM